MTATTNVIKNKSIRNGKIVWHGELHGPAVATGTTVTSAKSNIGAVLILLTLPCIPVNNENS